MTKEPKINVVLLHVGEGNYRIAISPELINGEFKGEILSVGEQGFPYGDFEGMKRLIKENRQILTAYSTQPAANHSMKTQKDLLFKLMGGFIGYEQVDVILRWKEMGVHLAELSDNTPLPQG